MTNIPQRVRALRFLRIIFLISFIVSIVSLATVLVALGVGSSREVSQAAGVTISVLTTICQTAFLVVVVLLGITLIASMSVNKGCRIAFWFGIIAAILAIVSGVLDYTLASRIPSHVLSMISTLCVAASIVTLIDGIYDSQQRKSPLWNFVCISIFLLVASTILSFVVFVAPMTAETSVALYLVSEVGFVLAYGIIWGCTQKSYTEVQTYLEREECSNEAK